MSNKKKALHLISPYVGGSVQHGLVQRTRCGLQVRAGMATVWSMIDPNLVPTCISCCNSGRVELESQIATAHDAVKGAQGTLDNLMQIWRRYSWTGPTKGKPAPPSEF